MGYTNYWRRSLRPEGSDPAAYVALVRDCWRLFAYCEHQGPALAGPFGDGTPEVTSDAVTFNGTSPADYETFRWERTARSENAIDSAGGVAFEFCKTGARPYDAVVVAFLLLARDHYGAAVEVSSDGEAEELQAGADLLSRAFPERAPYSVAAFLGGA